MTKWITGIVLVLFISALIVIGCRHQANKVEIAAPPKTEAVTAEKPVVASEQKKDADSLVRVDNASKNSSGTVSDSKEKDVKGKKSAKKTLPGDQFSEVMGKPTTSLKTYIHEGVVYEAIIPEIALVSYKVAAGDTLCKILWKSGMRPTEARCKRLAAINKLENVGKKKWWIYEGSTLEVPKPYFVRQTKVGINPTKTTRKEALEIGMKRTVNSLAEIEIKFDMPSSFLDGVPARIVGKNINLNKIVASSATFGRGVQGWTQTDIKSLKKTLEGPSVFLTTGALGFLIVEATACRNIYIIPFKRIKKSIPPDEIPPPENEVPGIIPIPTIPPLTLIPNFPVETEPEHETFTLVNGFLNIENCKDSGRAKLHWLLARAIKKKSIFKIGDFFARPAIRLSGLIGHGKAGGYGYEFGQVEVGPSMIFTGSKSDFEIDLTVGKMRNHGRDGAYSSTQYDYYTLAAINYNNSERSIDGCEVFPRYSINLQGLFPFHTEQKHSVNGVALPEQQYDNKTVSLTGTQDLYDYSFDRGKIIPHAKLNLVRDFGVDLNGAYAGVGFSVASRKKSKLVSFDGGLKDWTLLNSESKEEIEKKRKQSWELGVTFHLYPQMWNEGKGVLIGFNVATEAPILKEEKGGDEKEEVKEKKADEAPIQEKKVDMGADSNVAIITE